MVVLKSNSTRARTLLRWGRCCQQELLVSAPVVVSGRDLVAGHFDFAPLPDIPAVQPHPESGIMGGTVLAASRRPTRALCTSQATGP